MTSLEPISQVYSADELKKMNLLMFNLIKVDTNSKKYHFERVDAKSTFHNSNDLITGGFYKHTSLLISKNFYENL